MTIATAFRLFLWTQWMYISLGVMIYRNHIPDITVLENVTVGTIVLPNIRTHLGLSHNTAVKLGPGSLNQFFRLDSESGQLICTNTVDLESPALCRFEKSCCRLEGNGQQTEHASDKLTPSIYLEQNSSDLRRQFDQDGRTCRLMAFILASAATDTQLAPITRLHVTVVDLNDNAPTFNPDSVTDTKPLSSNHLQNHPFVQIAFLEGSGGLHGSQDLPMAFDADFSLTNRVARYWLEWDKSKISNEGSLEGRSASIQLNSILSTVGQDGLTWAILGPFRLTYLSHGRSIALELDSELDRETVSQYHILLVAEDGGGLQGRLHITVDVIDVNEFAPVFVESFPLPNKIMKSGDQEVYHKHYKVPESLPVGSEIGRLQATDDDKSPENIITYRLGPGTPQSKITKTFHLHPTTGSLTLLQSLDHETTRSYRLTVIAQDGTTADVATSKQLKEQQSHLAGRLSATAIVEISVTDVNDNAPIIRFEKSDQINRLSRPNGAQRFSTPFNHDVWIKEDLIKGSPVTFFSVSDNDSGENSRVSCTLMNWTDRFQLREFAGLHGLETVGEFDRESTDTYYLTVRCQDHGTPIQQTDAVITVHIEDVNDLPPTFDLPLYQFHVLENSPVGTRLLPLNSNYPSTVSAKDPDLNTTLHYRLEPSDPESTAHGVSRKVIDGSQGMDHHLFHIDPATAELTTHGELDRETRARLTFQVCADDGKHAAFTDVVVLLDDVNDNRPSFDRDTYVLRVEENQLSNSPLVVFKVTDADVDNQGFTFEFIEEMQPVVTVTRPADDGANHSDVSVYKNQPDPGTVRYHFALRDNTLYLRRSLDRELRSSYHFFIKVTDIQESKQVKDLGNAGLSVGLTSQAEIFVDVGDVNDNAPVLAFPNSTGPLGNRLSVSCHETMGSSVGRLQASDADLGPNATVVFSVIHTPEVDQLFYLDGQSGELFVNTGQLVARCGSSIILIISVDDQGPAESKRSRTAPVERLIIQLESKPTLAELIAAESRNKLGHLSNAAAGSALHNDEGADGTSVYGVLSTRTVLSVVLGGSTVFLITLLLVWIILLLYSRSRRQKRFRSLRVNQGKDKYETVTVASATQQQRSPEKVYLGPPQLVNQTTDDRSPYAERATTWNTFKSEKQRVSDSNASQQASTSIDLEHRGCSVGRINPDYAQSRTGTYSQFSKPDFLTGTVRSRSSPTITATTAFPLETQSDYMTAVWHLDGAENYQTCSLEYANQPEACLRSPKKTDDNFAAPFSLEIPLHLVSINMMR
ncbi:hypothetical protein CRM22_001067 [Opisthorchis felineus]|uniref:Cadherin domain-containing protein n=1 Tax=Opisthorchis felineus TaxID=147828 RepID=A0A4S2MIA2_OPIFE|nr:hypothetical protein CRM22_001067 [Opisthorchis felineus]